MLDTTTDQTYLNSERRAFAVHPSIIRSLIHEQASSLHKALAELVMNSVDAGASSVHIELNNEGFTVTDDGKGFTSRDEVEVLFEVFGSPHLQGDATYGRFRVGRGQIMAHGAITWRSGKFSMEVDIGRQDANLHYELVTHAEHQPGTVVSGIFAGRHMWLENEVQDLGEMVRYMAIPVHINGKLVSVDPATEQWDLQNEWAWYRFGSDGNTNIHIYDRGLFVAYKAAGQMYGRGGIIVSKQPLKLNMARNEINQDCDVWREIRKGARASFDLHLSKAKRLNQAEARALVTELISGKYVLSEATIRAIRKIKFIEDACGVSQSPMTMLGGNLAPGETHTFTVYDRKHAMVAERVQNEGLASVLPSWLFECGLRCTWGQEELEYLYEFRVVARLKIALGYSGTLSYLPLKHYVAELRSTHKLLSDQDLTIEQQLSLAQVRKINTLFGLARHVTRKIVVGLSDTATAWTDGISFIAITPECLDRLRLAGGAGHLVAILMHEYAHTDPSLEEHAHDMAFYQRFHQLMQKLGTHEVAERLSRAYMRGIAKAQIQPSKAVRYHVDQMAQLSPKLKAKRGSGTDQGKQRKVGHEASTFDNA